MAKALLSSPECTATAVVRPAMVDVWLDGMPPEPNERFQSHRFDDTLHMLKCAG